MKAALFAGDGSVQVREVEKPAPGPNDVLIRVEACGICGTDHHILTGDHDEVNYPIVPGHELAGEVVETGSDVRHVAVGDLVAVNPNMSCGVCEACLRARPHLCRRMIAIGVNLPGGFAQFVCVPARQALVMATAAERRGEAGLFPPLSAMEAAMLEPTSCCVHGIDMAGIRPGDAVVIQGAGPIGLILLQLARAAGGAPVVVVEPSEQRRQMARELGADAVLSPVEYPGDAIVQPVRELTGGEGADVVIEASGHPAAAAVSIALARRGGRVVFFGVQPTDAKPLEVHPRMIYREELTIVGSFVNPFTDGRARRMLVTRRVKVRPLITHVCGLEAIADAVEAIRQGETGKVMVLPWAETPELRPAEAP